MSFKKMISTVSVHAAGAHNEVIVGGVLDVPGTTMFEKARYLETSRDELRQFLLHEPRGKVIQCCNLVLPSTIPGVDAGFVIMESSSYPPMSGTNTMSTVTAILETGLLPMREPVTELKLETPGGVIGVRAECHNGRCTSVEIENLPSFVFGLDVPLDIPGFGPLKVDVAYGGMIYALVNAADVGLRIVPSSAREFVEIGERIKSAAALQYSAVHPENPGIHTVNQVLFYEPAYRDADGALRGRNTVVVSPGRLDRSPCGTGTSARLATMLSRREIAVGEVLHHESITGTIFTGVIASEKRVGGFAGIVPKISGRAWITGFHTHVLEASDPIPTGYRLTDTWPLDGEGAAVNPQRAAHVTA